MIPKYGLTADHYTLRPRRAKVLSVPYQNDTLLVLSLGGYYPTAYEE